MQNGHRVLRSGDLCFIDYAQPLSMVRSRHVAHGVIVSRARAREVLGSDIASLAGTPIPIDPHRRWLAIVGSTGQPRDRNPAAAYALFDLARQQITFCRVVYDAVAAANRIRQCGLPASLAYRVELGI